MTGAALVKIWTTMEGSAVRSIRLSSMTALGPFSWRWAEHLESFERGWAAVATVDGQEVHIRSCPATGSRNG